MSTNACECPRACCLSLSASAHQHRAPFIYPRRLPHGRDQAEVLGEATDWNRAAVEALRRGQHEEVLQHQDHIIDRLDKTHDGTLYRREKKTLVLATEAIIERGNKDREEKHQQVLAQLAAAEIRREEEAAQLKLDLREHEQRMYKMMEEQQQEEIQERAAHEEVLTRLVKKIERALEELTSSHSELRAVTPANRDLAT